MGYSSLPSPPPLSLLFPPHSHTQFIRIYALFSGPCIECVFICQQCYCFVVLLNKTGQSYLEKNQHILTDFSQNGLVILNVILRYFLNSGKGIVRGSKKECKSVWRQRTLWYLFWVVFSLWHLSQWPIGLLILSLGESASLSEVWNLKENRDYFLFFFL